MPKAYPGSWQGAHRLRTPASPGRYRRAGTGPGQRCRTRRARSDARAQLGRARAQSAPRRFSGGWRRAAGRAGSPAGPRAGRQAAGPSLPASRPPRRLGRGGRRRPPARPLPQHGGGPAHLVEEEVGVGQQVVRPGAEAAGGAAGLRLEAAAGAGGAGGAEAAGGGAAGDVLAQVVLAHHLHHRARPRALQEGPRGQHGARGAAASPPIPARTAGGGGRRGGGEGGAPLPIVPRGRAREAARGGSPVALVTALARPRLRRPEGRRKGAHAPPGPPPPLAGKLLGGPRGLRHSALRGPHLSQRAGVGSPAAGRYRVRRLPVALPQSWAAGGSSSISSAEPLLPRGRAGEAAAARES